MMLHHRPDLFLSGIISFLKLGDLSDMMVHMDGEQTSDSVFWEMRIGAAEKCGDLVGIRGKMSQSRILPAFISGHGGLGIFFDRTIVIGEQGKEPLGCRFAVKRPKRPRKLSCVGHHGLLCKIPRPEIVRRVVQDDIPNPKEVSGPLVTQDALHVCHSGRMWVFHRAPFVCAAH